jgi:hypothetical protein
LETVAVSDGEDDDIQEIPLLDLTPTHSPGTSSAGRPTKRRHARQVSPEVYWVHFVNRTKLGTLETDISSSFTLTPSFSVPKRIRVPETSPSTLENPASYQQKRTLHDDDEVVELSAGFPTPETQSFSTRRRLFTATSFQNPDPFASDFIKPTQHRKSEGKGRCSGYAAICYAWFINTIEETPHNTNFALQPPIKGCDAFNRPPKACPSIHLW